MKIPENTIIMLPDHPYFKGTPEEVVESMDGNMRRDWMSVHAYHCLPITIGNQYGIAIKNLQRFTATWDGTDGPNGVTIECDETARGQHVSSHFGMGLITIQNRFVFRTPSGVNLMTIAPPNVFKDGIGHVTGVVETDNLRRDFTFNLKIMRPNVPIAFDQGTVGMCATYT